MKTIDFAEQWYSMQKAFLLAPQTSDTLKENTRRFWENQERILNNMQVFANGWFERRHTGALAACEVTERMCGTPTIVGLVQAYQDWAFASDRAGSAIFFSPAGGAKGGDVSALVAAKICCWQESPSAIIRSNVPKAQS